MAAGPVTGRRLYASAVEGDPDLDGPFRLDHRTALVTGASRGIGEAIARALDRAGARVAVAARDTGRLQSLAADLRQGAVVLETDLSVASAPRQLAHRALEAFGHVDVLVNNAAIAARLAAVEIDADLVDRMYAVNVRAPLLLTTALIPAMARRRRERSSTSRRCPAWWGHRGGRPTPPPRAPSTP